MRIAAALVAAILFFLAGCSSVSAADDWTLDGTRLVVQGDSLTQSFDSPDGPRFRSSWPMLAAAESEGQLQLIANAARGGLSSSQLQPLFADDVLTHEPTLVGLMPGRNDGQPDGSVEDLANYVEDAVSQSREAGADVFLVNTVPQGTAELKAPSPRVTVLRGHASATLSEGLREYVVTSGNGSTLQIEGETPPSEPISVRVPAGAAIQLYWDAVPGANWYRVYKRTGAGAFGLVAEVAPSAAPGFLNAARIVIAEEQAPGPPPPTANTTARPLEQLENRQRINAWLADYAEEEGLVLVDVYSALAAPDGRWKPGLTYDGTHPTAAAAQIIADAVVDALGPELRPLERAAGEGLPSDSLQLAVNPAALSSQVEIDGTAIEGGTPTLTTLTSDPFEVEDGDSLSFTVRTGLAERGGLCSIRLLDAAGDLSVEHAYVDIDIEGSVTQPLHVLGDATIELRLSGAGTCAIDELVVGPTS